MLVDALSRIAMATDLVDISIVMQDVLDCGDEAGTTRRKHYMRARVFSP